MKKMAAFSLFISSLQTFTAELETQVTITAAETNTGTPWSPLRFLQSAHNAKTWAEHFEAAAETELAEGMRQEALVETAGLEIAKARWCRAANENKLGHAKENEAFVDSLISFSFDERIVNQMIFGVPNIHIERLPTPEVYRLIFGIMMRKATAEFNCLMSDEEASLLHERILLLEPDLGESEWAEGLREAYRSASEDLSSEEFEHPVSDQRGLRFTIAELADHVTAQGFPQSGAVRSAAGRVRPCRPESNEAKEKKKSLS